MKPTDDTIKLEWCYTHNTWYVDNNGCPDCTIDQLKEEHTKESIKLVEQIDELQNKLDNVEDNI